MVRALAIQGRDDKADVLDLGPAADPGPGQVRVTVEAASVNGIDAAIAAGYLWHVFPHTFPVVIGRDFAGIADAVGSAVTTVTPGDRITGVLTAMSLGSTGGIAESLTVDADTVVPVPDGVTSAQAAAIGLAGVTALDLLGALDLTSGDVVLISGATGGVGVFAIQLAVAAGATVIATARPGEASELVHRLGAAPAVDYTGDLAAAVRAVAPDGVTAVVHAAGDPAELAAVIRPGGRLASALSATAEQAGRDDITVTPVVAVASREKLSALLAEVAAGRLEVPIAHTYALAQAAAALADFSVVHKLGKLVVAPH
jgi:NADPH:quinone reductase-like Zn-dependent oxidoreductase